MSEKCYRCGKPKATTLKGQWLEADLADKTMSLFFLILMVGLAGLMISGIVALGFEIAHSY